jgi:hypothetical protein
MIVARGERQEKRDPGRVVQSHSNATIPILTNEQPTTSGDFPSRQTQSNVVTINSPNQTLIIIHRHDLQDTTNFSLQRP